MPITSKTSAHSMRIKSVATEGDEAGRFKAMVSVFGNVDSMNDVVMPGAFKRSIEEWEQRGNPIPVIWAHDHKDPFSHIGHVIKAVENQNGLEVDAQLDLENPTAQQVHRMLKGRRCSQFSFAYNVRGSVPAERDGKSITELTDLELIEVGPCLTGANTATALLDVKSAPTDPDPRDIAAGWLRCLADAPRITPAGLFRWTTDMEITR